MIAGFAACYGVTAAAAIIDDEQFKIAAFDATNSDAFALDVAASNNVAIVGAGGDYFFSYQTGLSRYPGAAYLVNATSGELIFKLTPDDSRRRDGFGKAVAIDGNRALVGASDAAYVFDVTTGQQLWKLAASDSVDEFGYAVAISGNVAVVGAEASAYLFDLTTGAEIRKLNVSETSDDSAFHTVAVSSDYLLLGAIGDDHAGYGAGAAFLFDAATGVQLHKLTASDATRYQYFGASVSIRGNLALVGAYSEGGSEPGAAYLFDLTTGQELMKLTSPAAPVVDEHGSEHFDRFGISAALLGNYALIGGPNERNAGAAYLFDITTGQIVKTYQASDARAFDYFGFSVALGERFVLAGRTPESGEPGALYIFSLTPEPGSLALTSMGGVAVCLGIRRRRAS
jgi:outer membrane protein assembly factor BamB